MLSSGKKAKDEAAKKAAFQASVDATETLLSKLDEKNPYTAGARAATLYSRGVGERMLGDLGKAIRTFSEAIELNPDLGEAYFRRGICFHYIGEDNMALTDFVESANINYDDPRANLWEGFTQAKLGNYHEAVRAYGNAITASDRYTPAYMNRGLAYMALGEYDKAIADFNAAIRLEPTNADYYFKRGLAYEQLGDSPESRPSRSPAQSSSTNKHAAAHRHLADALQRLGRTRAGQQYRQKANQLAPPERSSDANESGALLATDVHRSLTVPCRLARSERRSLYCRARCHKSWRRRKLRTCSFVISDFRVGTCCIRR